MKKNASYKRKTVMLLCTVATLMLLVGCIAYILPLVPYYHAGKEWDSKYGTHNPHSKIHLLYEAGNIYCFDLSGMSIKFHDSTTPVEEEMTWYANGLQELKNGSTTEQALLAGKYEFLSRLGYMHGDDTDAINALCNAYFENANYTADERDALHEQISLAFEMVSEHSAKRALG